MSTGIDTAQACAKRERMSDTITTSDILTISPRFAFTLDVFGPFYLLSYFASLKKPVLLILQLVVFIALPVWFNRVGLSHGSYGRTVSIVLIALFTTYILCPPVLALVAWSRLYRQPMVKGLRTVGFSAQTVFTNSALFDLKLDWQAILKVRKSLGLIIFYTQKYGGILVPVSAFSDNAAAQAFYDRAMACFTAAKSGAAKSTLDG